MTKDVVILSLSLLLFVSIIIINILGNDNNNKDKIINELNIENTQLKHYYNDSLDIVNLKFNQSYSQYIEALNQIENHNE